MNNKYGYKICYCEKDKLKLKLHLVTNSYSHAKWRAEYFAKHQQTDKKNRIIKNATWHVFPIKNFIEYKWLWRGCPF